MYRNVSILSTALLLVIAAPASSGDLYLLSIDSAENLQVARNIVEYAHGMLGDRFLIDVNAGQLERLKSAGVSVELILEDFTPDRFYLLSEIHREIRKSALYFEPIYASQDNYLVEMAAEEIDILRKDGYAAVCIGELKTPFFYKPRMSPARFQQSYPSDTLADLINQDSLYSYDTRLEAFYTRYYTTDSICRARDWLVNKFEEFGYTDVTIDTFYYNSHPCHNVKCFKPGIAEPDELIVIGGHYDSINFGSPAEVYAPGADDNASGTSVVLELARIMSDIETKKSILFVAFSAEEVGLVGSYFVANHLYYDTDYDVECMINFDMVAYTEDEDDDVALYSGAARGYADALADAALRVTDLIPMYAGQAGNSDHASFNRFGYMVAYVQEGDFNFDGWHTNLDISSRLDFPYFEEVVRMAAAGIGYICNAAHLTPIDDIFDFGNGQALRVIWGDCDASYSYAVLYGTESGIYTDTIAVPPDACQLDIGGLMEGQEYYITVLGVNLEGYGPVYLMESSGASHIMPQAPAGFAAEPDYQKIVLHWRPNKELDLDYYRALRRQPGADWTVLQDYVTDTSFEDITAQAHIEYEYVVLAVDVDQNESDSSSVMEAIAATFDLPLLFVDETSSAGSLNPSEADQAEFYNNLFAGVGHKCSLDAASGRLNRSLAGQYGSIIWLDDDLAGQLFEGSIDSVEWYLGYGTNLCLAGWQTIYWLTESENLSPGDFVYDNFGISRVIENTDFDFIGAYGENDWPDLQTSPDNPFSGFLASISVFEVLPGAEVIYTFHSNSGSGGFDGKPCGVIYDTDSGKKIALGFPVYHLTRSTAKALMDRIFDEFEIESSYLYGDVDVDGRLNLIDITFLIAYLFKGGQSPTFPNLGDADGDCEITISDIIYLINSLYKGGPAPVEGCAE